MFRGGERQFPSDTPVVMGRDPGVDSSETLATVNDGAADRRPFLVDSSNGAAIDSEGEIVLLEGAEQRAILELLLDVGVNVAGGQAGGGKVEGCVTGIWRRDEGDIEAKDETFEKLRAIKVGAEGFFPCRYVEGRPGKWNLDTVHVCRVAGEKAGAMDPLDVPGLVVGAGSEGELVTRAG